MSATEWISAIDKRPSDRNRRDADLIAHRLRRVEALDRLPHSILHQLALVGYYEDLEKGVTLFRQGDPGSSWYAVLAGSVEVRYEGAGGDLLNAVTLCTLGVGSTFGESILNPLPRDTTVLTRTTCELLRVERRDFRAIWEKNKELMDQFVASCKINHKNGYTAAEAPPGTPCSPCSTPLTSRRSASPEEPDPAKPITDVPGAQAVRIGCVLRHLLVAGFAPESLRGALTLDGQVIFSRGRRAWTGSDLVDWLIEVSGGLVRSRQQACAMWQCLLEEGVIAHVAGELPFLDTDAFYGFFMDKPPGEALPSAKELETAEDDLHDAIDVMHKRAPHATLRYILRKPPHERSEDDLEMVYDELMRIRALSHLGNSVRRELAHVIVFESHPKAGEVLFQQGDEGHSWYIILRGSVDVVIHGKGVVCTLAEGDDFGKLALINDAPRAASIVLREPNCHFLRVDKDHFNRILRDVEANTVRLKEHGVDVLILEKISNTHSHFKYTVMAGTSQKMLEHLLETRLAGVGSSAGSSSEALYGDPFLEDFLLTHIVFMPTQQLVAELARHYRIESTQEQDFLLACKRRVVQFVNCWVHTVRHPVFDDPHSLNFLEELAGEVEQDAILHPSLQEEAAMMHHVMSQLRRYQEDRAAAAGQKWKLPPCGQPVAPFSNASSSRGRAVIRPTDDIIFRVYCADHTYCTLRCPVASTAEHIKLSAADKLKLGPTEDLVLVEVRSSGERIVIPDNDLSVPTGLGGLNARLFVAPREHIDALTPLLEQEGATEAIDMDLELFSMKELAYHLTLFDWDLFWSVHEYELLYKTFGRQGFNQITANLDVFLRRFNEIQYWVITEVCLAGQLSKRASVLRKMIKLAQYCREYKNLNALFAIVMGLGNVAVSRLSLTWEKLPSKSRKTFTELEALIDPTRNHRAYRLAVGKLSPPIIPFMPLLIKDMTFTHEGNKTFSEGHLVNFEKMHMLAQTMRSIRNCRSRHLVLEPFSPKCEQDVKEYIGALRVIDNTRMLTSLSQKLEPRRS